ncbi:MAG: DUF815 domain-containing protein, partial [Rhodobiaceae bacterium]|nr:DUF815 domain-containing protein [Rhodobiaceae bacterium]
MRVIMPQKNLDNPDLFPLLTRIADALDRMAPEVKKAPLLDQAEAFSWDASNAQLVPVPKVARVDLLLLHGIAQVRDILIENTRRFAQGLPAN